MKSRSLIMGAALALISSFAIAGLVQDVPVQIIQLPDGRGAAQGVMTTARVARNDVEFIGCGVAMATDGASLSYQYAFCQATDGKGVHALCQTTRPDMVQAVRSIADFSYISFDWNANGECVWIKNSTQSQYLPGVAY